MDTDRGGVPRVQISDAAARAFGAVGSAVQSLGENLEAEREKREQTSALIGLREASLEGRKLLAEKRDGISADGFGFAKDVRDTFQARVNKRIRGLPKRLQPEYQQRANFLVESLELQALEIERDQSHKFANKGVDDALGDLQIILDRSPSSYERVLKQGMEAIDNGVGASLPDDFRRQRKELWEQSALFTRELALLRSDPQHSNIYLNDNGVVADQSLPSEAQALLNAIAGTESPGYNVMNGGERFDNFLDHPRRIGAGGTTTAAGRYMYVQATWDRVARAIGAADFGPVNQDRGAWWLAQQDYAANTGRDLLSDIRAGEFSRIRRGLSTTWEGLHKTTDSKFAKSMQRGGAASVPEGLSFENYRRLQNEAIKQLNASEAARRRFETALSSDPMGHFSQTGQIEQVAFNSPDTFQQRAEDFRGVLEQYENTGIVVDKPLSKQEVTQLSDIMQNGTTEEKVSALGSLSELGEFTDMALRQVKEDDGRIGYVADMVNSGSQEATQNAADILDGHELLSQNPDQAKAILETGDEGGTLPIFNDAIGLSLLNVDGPTASAAKAAADALYLSRQVRSGNAEFDQSAYEQAVEDVLGGQVYEHNGMSIVLPSGVEEDQFEDFLSELDAIDLELLSYNDAPPVFGNGEPVTPEWFEDEARFVQVGQGLYGFIDMMGNKLADAQGNAYIMELDSASIDEVLARGRIDDAPVDLIEESRRDKRQKKIEKAGELGARFGAAAGPARAKVINEDLMKRLPEMSLREMDEYLRNEVPFEFIPELSRSAFKERFREERQKSLNVSVATARESEAAAQSGIMRRIETSNIEQLENMQRYPGVYNLSADEQKTVASRLKDLRK